jgi:YhcH/YjgK/YiaL family protein
MVFDSLKNSAFYHRIHPLFEKAFDYAHTTNFNELPLGRHAIVGDDLFVIYMEYLTKDISDCVMESHRKYVDIQYMLEGEEGMAYETFNGQRETTPYELERDVAFYEKSYTSLIKVSKGQFTIFYPHDLHMPSMKIQSPATVKKAVFKVRVA